MSNGNGLVKARREAVAEIYSGGVTNRRRISDELKTRQIINPRTGKAYTEATIRRDLETIQREPVAEMIGRTAVQVSFVNIARVTVDRTEVNHEFWSKFRRGTAKGYELGGLFAKPIGRILAGMVMGHPPTITSGNDATDEQIAAWQRKEQVLMGEWLFDSYTLGDSYVVVNPDATLTPVQPNQVKVKTNPLDFSEVTAYEITSRLENVALKDIYRKDGRTLEVQQMQYNATFGTVAQGVRDTVEFENLTGEFPVIHIPNEREANEINGHPIYESLLTLFAEYDDVLTKALSGVKLMGNPIPVIEGASNPDEEKARLSNEDYEYEDAGGTDRTRDAIDFTQETMLFLGEGATFSFKSPGSFTGDAGRMLEYLFLLMLQHAQIIEGVWGGAIASSRASLSEQMDAFLLYIDTLRAKFEPYLLMLVRQWLRTRGLVEPGLASVAESEDLQIEWPELSKEDAQVRLAYITGAYDRSLVTDQTALELMQLVDDPAAEVQAAEEENQAKADAFEARAMRGEMPNQGGNNQNPQQGNQGQNQQQENGVTQNG